jgi:hypothetical protein
MGRFEREVDPDGVLPYRNLEQRAEAARAPDEWIDPGGLGRILRRQAGYWTLSLGLVQRLPSFDF